MKNNIFFLFLLSIILACGSTNKSSTLNAVAIRWSIPLVNPADGSLQKMADSCYLYYLDSLVLIRVPYAHTEYSYGKINDTKTNRDTTSVIKKETKFKNYIFKKDNPFGLQFETITSISFQRFNVDSLLKAKTFKGVRFYNEVNDTLVESIKISDEILLEKYIPKTKIDESYSDSTYLYLNSDLNGINYTLSKQIDSLKKKKLYQVKYIYNEIPNGISGHVTLPKREFIFSFTEMRVENQIEIINFFNRFKKYSK
ncbi:hypothetical protein [Pedobacter boryungensis]|uniref:Lipoprotein n=1 Tax=Pedobacter boryungensis TaxID=869962 RepID=A0ABX2DEP8_9SPHI|nr:hypothetical protein [Pedobacter boryungensis]NQX31436.1 hypothetical protein [Pedobacter boryungensis]